MISLDCLLVLTLSSVNHRCTDVPNTNIVTVVGNILHAERSLSLVANKIWGVTVFLIHYSTSL